jgi:signal transduction histidine kinase
VLRDFVTARCRAAPKPTTDTSGVTAIEASDLATINHWFSVTRVRNSVLVAIAVPVLAWVTALDLPLLVIWGLCATSVGFAMGCRRWVARGTSLLALAYVQMGFDVLTVAIGLAAMGANGLLFGAFFVMTIVPAAMVSGGCVAFVVVLSAACWGVLLAVAPLDAMHAVTPAALFAVIAFVFGAVGNQCFFYKQHLRDKNRVLGASGDRLAAANVELVGAVETARGLLEVGRALGNSLDLGILLDRLHSVATERLRTDWCATLLLDSTNPAGYRMVGGRGLGGATHAPLGAAFWEFGALVSAEELVEITNAAAGPTARALHGWPIASGLFTVLRCGNRAVGIFATGYRERTGGYAPFQKELALGIATQAAVAIENSTLHTRQREEAEISAALLEVAELLNASLDAGNALDRLTALACKLTGYDFVNVALLDPARGTYRITAGTDVTEPHHLEDARQLELDPRELPIFAAAARTGWTETDSEPEIVPPEWLRLWHLASVSAVPLMLRGEMLGVLTGGWHDRKGPAGMKTRRLMWGIAHQAVAGIQNGRLVQNLRAANGLKSEFIGTMSHELRTPLNAIIGYNELLAEGQFGPVTEEQRAICAKVLDYSRQLLELIQATLDVSRMESGALPVTLAPVEIAGLLQELAGQVPETWVKPNVRLEFEVQPGIPTVQTDYAKLKMVIRNLVHNALKFTDTGSVRVEARLEPDGSAVSVAVADSGIGISTEAQAIIFDMFRQVDGSDRRRHDGVGLGLYIVRRLTVLLGGTITVESEPGRGSRFCVRLPHDGVATRSAPASVALSA